MIVQMAMVWGMWNRASALIQKLLSWAYKPNSLEKCYNKNNSNSAFYVIIPASFTFLLSREFTHNERQKMAWSSSLHTNKWVRCIFNKFQLKAHSLVYCKCILFIICCNHIYLFRSVVPPIWLLSLSLRLFIIIYLLFHWLIKGASNEFNERHTFFWVWRVHSDNNNKKNYALQLRKFKFFDIFLN